MLGLLPLLYAGRTNTAKCFKVELITRLTGLACLDAGRHRNVEYMDGKEMMEAVGAPDSAEMER